MRKYNASESKVLFAGIDMHMHTTLMQQLRQRIEACPEVSRLAYGIAGKLQHLYLQPYRIDPALAEEIDADLRTLASGPEIGTLPDERAWVMRTIELLPQFFSQAVDIDWCDRGMADNTLWLLE